MNCLPSGMRLLNSLIRLAFILLIFGAPVSARAYAQINGWSFARVQEPALFYQERPSTITASFGDSLSPEMPSGRFFDVHPSSAGRELGLEAGETLRNRCCVLNNQCHKANFECADFSVTETWLGFAGIEGSKQPQDLGVNAHVGGRIAMNVGRLILSDFISSSRISGLGVQAGTSVNSTANAVQVMERIEGTTSRWQSFSTLGLFRRSETGFSWGAGYDFLFQDYFDTAFLGQWRFELWQFVFEQDEIGLTVALKDRSDIVSFLGSEYEYRSLTYGRVNWRRHWESGAYTTFWVGLAGSHSELNVALGDLPDTGRQLLFGSDLRCPLNDYLSLYGEANFLMPSDTGAVDAFLGIEVAMGRSQGCRIPVSSFQSRPVLPLAGSTTFIVNPQRR